jgi:hypothetical protein
VRGRSVPEPLGKPAAHTLGPDAFEVGDENERLIFVDMRFLWQNTHVSQVSWTASVCENYAHARRSKVGRHRQDRL